MVLNTKELQNINGGAISPTLLNSLAKGLSLLFELGRAVGSGIRRAASGKTCSV